jgi:hypothetical protein
MLYSVLCFVLATNYAILSCFTRHESGDGDDDENGCQN